MISDSGSAYDVVMTMYVPSVKRNKSKLLVDNMLVLLDSLLQ